MDDSQKVSTSFILRQIIQAYLLLVAFKFLYAAFLVFLTNKAITSEIERVISRSTQTSDWLKYYFIVEVSLLGPVMEELAFRGLIVKKRQVVIVSCGVFLYMLVARLTGTNFYLPGVNTGWILVLSSLFVFLFHQTISQNLIRFTSRNRTATVLISSACFALWHYYNFDFSKANAFEIALNLLPHFISGLLFAFFALRYGIEWSILLHILNNAIPLILVMAA